MAPDQTTVIQVGEISLAKAFLSVQAAANKKAETIFAICPLSRIIF